MLQLFIYFLSFLMFLDCICLVGLVLLQLPKKEAGAGLAFGSSATDALFGAGSGNVLTKVTKYVAGAFFGLALLMTILTAHTAAPSARSAYDKAISQGSSGSIPASDSGASTAGPGAASTAPKPPSGKAPQFLNVPTSNAPSAPTAAPGTNK